ncbi:hypothetical protein GSI_08913 [Ganoderma sinense ZZ0214-1]|uniref:Uncharacterized protein n=1 Tax=Ganoderma sinense ZZ0214-1 TaxID=1077348 RepID=A0A2G8S557_9APHY|nr:hypothetical protein GSI_08913 [Ganoderma sinense ZZ0214-1]
MRFLDTKTGQFVEVTDIRDVDYAILSHTWDRRGEQNFQDLRRIQDRYTREASSSCPSVAESGDNAPADPVLAPRSIWDDPDLSPKIRDACAVARANGFDLLWIDSCCIDKTSSAELSEAINSMYAWYARSEVCFAYLVDVPPHGDHRAENSQFRKSVWFTRGWTLQELIAPFEVIILSQDWNTVGSKRDLVDLIEEITNISAEALLHDTPLDKYSVAQRLSWASKRETTRVEDQAYSLLGMFDIHMPTLYGEGERAFRRLQEAIMQRIPDQSLFAWRSIYSLVELNPGPPFAPAFSNYTRKFLCARKARDASILASSPSDFVGVSSVIAVPHDDVHSRLQLPQLPVPEYAFTPHGIRTRLPVIPLSLFLPSDSTYYTTHGGWWYLAVLGCEPADLPDHFLGLVCNIPPSNSGIQFLYSGTAMVLGPPVHSYNDPHDLFPLSPGAIEHCRPHMELKEVYIPHLNREPEHGYEMLTEVVLGKPLKAIHLILPGRSSRDLPSSYTAELRGPDSDAFPTIHWLKLSQPCHTITIEYEHALREGGTYLTINGKVTVSQPEHLPPSSEIYAKPSSMVWEDRVPWRKELSSHVVDIAAFGSRLKLELSMKLVRRSYYSLVVQYRF